MRCEAKQQQTLNESGTKKADGLALMGTIFKSVLEKGANIKCLAQSEFESIVVDRDLLTGIRGMNYTKPSRVQVSFLFHL